jgi:hypothetical protein
MDQHTNHACPEPSARPSEKTNTSISTVPYLDKPPAKPRRHRDLHNEVYVFDLYDVLDRFHTDENVATVMKVGRVAIITRGRYAGKKVRQIRLSPPPPSTQDEILGEGKAWMRARGGKSFVQRDRETGAKNLQMELEMGKFKIWR